MSLAVQTPALLIRFLITAEEMVSYANLFTAVSVSYHQPEFEPCQQLHLYNAGKREDRINTQLMIKK